MKIKRGDACSVPVAVSFNGQELNLSDVEKVEFMVGGIRKLYPGVVGYDGANGGFQIPLSQQETFSFQGGTVVPIDCRVKFIGGAVDGFDKYIYLTVTDSESEEVL